MTDSVSEADTRQLKGDKDKKKMKKESAPKSSTPPADAKKDDASDEMETLKLVHYAT